MIAKYRVYLVDRKLRQTLVGETTDTCFRNDTAPSGKQLRYVVTTVQRSGQESGWSKMLGVSVP